MDAEPSEPRGLQDFLTWLEVNKVKVAAITAAVSAVIIITAVYLHQESQREIRASEILSEIRTPINPTAPLTPEMVTSYLAMAESHSGSKAAARALLRVGGSYFLDGKYAEAQAMFERFQKEYPNSEWADQAALGLASSLEALGQTDQAATKYEDIRSRYSNTAVADEATLGLARIQETQGKKEEAIKLYHSLSESSQTSIGARAGMRKEEMIKTDPALTNAIAPILPVASLPEIPPPTIVTTTSTEPTTVTGQATASNVIESITTNTPQIPVPAPVQPPAQAPEQPAPTEPESPAPTKDPPPEAPKAPPAEAAPEQPPGEQPKGDEQKKPADQPAEEPAPPEPDL